MTQISSAIEILQRTDDGERLTPKDLKLVELAANSWLNEQGEVALAGLLCDVTSGSYFTSSRRWFHGIEHLTKDHDGYVHWKGERVEHYSFQDTSAEREAAVVLAQRCQALEQRRFPVTWRTVGASDCCEAEAGTPWMLGLMTYYGFFEKEGEVTGVFYRQNVLKGQPEVVSVTRRGAVALLHYDDSAYTAFHRLQRAGYTCMPSLPSYAESVSRLERLGVMPQWLDELVQSSVI